MIQLPVLPAEPLVTQARLVTTNWLRWLVDVLSPVYQFGVRQVANTLALTNRAASLPTQDVLLPAPNTGRYRVGVYAKLTQAATTSSDLTVHVHSVDPTDGTSVVWDSPTISGNVLTEAIQAYVPVDSQTVAVSTTYTSVGATPMQYKLSVTVEALPR